MPHDDDDLPDDAPLPAQPVTVPPAAPVSAAPEPDPDGLVQIAVRIPRRLLTALDAEVASQRQGTRPTFSRSDYLRELLAWRLRKGGERPRKGAGGGRRR